MASSSSRPCGKSPVDRWKETPAGRSKRVNEVAVATEDLNVPLDRLSMLKGPRVTFRPETSKPRISARSRGSGKLAHFLNIPLDVFFEIASALNPIDLLHFSRISKHFRCLLLSRSTRFVWAAARGNVPNFPDLPEDLNEPQYASLVFDRTCQACGCVRAQMGEYAIRVRLCVPCHRKNFESGESLMRKFGTKLNKGILTLMPRSLLLPASAAVRRQRPVSQMNGQRNYYYTLEFKMVATRFLALKKVGNRENLVKFVREQQVLASQLLKHAFEIVQYEEFLKRSKEEHDKPRMLRREARITEELSSLGWSKEYYPHQNPEWCAIVKQPKELSSRTWNGICPKLVQLLDENKTQIISQRFHIRQKEFTPLWNRFLATLPKVERLTMPRFVDVVQFPSIKDLFMADNGKLAITQGRWVGIAADFTKDVEEYRSRAKSQLVQIMQEGSGAVTHTSEQINNHDSNNEWGFEALSKALFCCHRKQCQDLIPYPDIMQHIHYFPPDDHTQDHLFPGISCPSVSGA